MDKSELILVFNILISAGEKILEFYKTSNFSTAVKSDNSLVTSADKASSRIINERLRNLFPDIPILDEENSIPEYINRKNWEEFFLVDPLDGTKEFINQNGEFCINLARIKNQRPVEGWIYQPVMGKGWYCKKGEGIFEFDNSGITKKTKIVESKTEILRIITSRSFFKPREKEIIDKMGDKYPFEIIHRGSSIKQIAMVLGLADMYMKAGPCSEWDTAPGQLMVEECGGAVLRHDNFLPLTYNKPILANPHFVMLNKELNSPDFIQFLKEQIQN